MRAMNSVLQLALFALILSGLLTLPAQAQHELTNGPGDGTVSVVVDGYGAFGSAAGINTDDAIYDPVGPQTPAGTVFESAVLFRAGSSGPRTALTSGDFGEQDGLTNPLVTGTSTTANSSFTIGGLNVTLEQTLLPLFIDNQRAGSELTQTYTITNPGASVVSFEFLRYLDGDIDFDGSIVDGGGRFVSATKEYMFEIDQATGALDPTTFVGITGEGGIIPSSGRYEATAYDELQLAALFGDDLTDTIEGDSADADQFVDAGQGYDVTIALSNEFTLGPGQSTTYTTRTAFGTGAPADIPEPSSLALLAAAGTLLRRRR